MSKGMGERWSSAHASTLCAGIERRGGGPLGAAGPRLVLGFLARGQARMVLGGRLVTLPPRALFAFAANLPHHLMEMSPEAELSWIAVSLRSALGFRLGRDVWRTLAAGELLVGQGELDESERFAQWVDDVCGGNAYRMRTVELEIEARLLRVATPASCPDDIVVGAQLDWGAAMLSFVDENFLDELRIEDVAEHVGLNAHYAMTVFRRCYGLTLVQYIQRRRLACAQVLLLTTERTVLEVAFASGFGSLPRFYAAFKSMCGSAPGYFRRAHRKTAASAAIAWAA